ADWLRFFEGRDIFLHYVSNRFGCCAPMDSFADKILPKAATYEWPTAEEIWTAFHGLYSSDQNSPYWRLHGYIPNTVADFERWRDWYFCAILEDRSYARDYARQMVGLRPGDSGYSYARQEYFRYPQEAERKFLRFRQQFGVEAADALRTAVETHEKTLPEGC